MVKEPYGGSSRRLVISFDVGTTFSGISYSILEPGAVPKICTVTRFPGQEHVASSSKIPTVLYYDKYANVRAVGAETELDQIVEQAEDEEWLKVQWFKLRLRPRSMSSSVPIKQVTPLPASKTATDVLSDFLHYLMSCAKNFITDTHPTILQSWGELLTTTTFILSHPNGWEGAQQARYRRASIQAGLVPNTLEGKSRIVFVSEGEASLNYCIRGDYIDKLDTKSGFIVADMGGGTLDFSAYKAVGVKPLRVEEMAAARCELQGSALVTERAKTFIKDKLQTSEKYGQMSTIEAMVNAFDRTTKRVYRGLMDAVCYITFGLQTDKDLANDIRAGRLKLNGEQVAHFFDPSVEAAMNAIAAQIREAPLPVSSVYLVGGFSANQYLVSELRTRLAEKKIAVHCPDGQTIKAVADGSISYFVEHYVSARIAKASFLARHGVDYDAKLDSHNKRKHRLRVDPSGRQIISGAYQILLQQGTTVRTETEYRSYFCNEKRPQHVKSSDNIHFPILCYRGSESPPRWDDEDLRGGTLKEVCKVTVPVSHLKYATRELVNMQRERYIQYDYSIIVRFGGPEIKAQLAWQGKSGEQRSPAEIIYEDVEDDYDSDDIEDDSKFPIRTLDKGNTE